MGAAELIARAWALGTVEAWAETRTEARARMERAGETAIAHEATTMRAVEDRATAAIAELLED
jgi:hypothetical protein